MTLIDCTVALFSYSLPNSWIIISIVTAIKINQPSRIQLHYTLLYFTKLIPHQFSTLLTSLHFTPLRSVTLHSTPLNSILIDIGSSPSVVTLSLSLSLTLSLNVTLTCSDSDHGLGSADKSQCNLSMCKHHHITLNGRNINSIQFNSIRGWPI